MTEADMARRECKASSVLSKWKETENRALNGGGPEDDAAGESERMEGGMPVCPSFLVKTGTNF